MPAPGVKITFELFMFDQNLDISKKMFNFTLIWHAGFCAFSWLNQ